MAGSSGAVNEGAPLCSFYMRPLLLTTLESQACTRSAPPQLLCPYSHCDLATALPILTRRPRTCSAHIRSRPDFAAEFQSSPHCPSPPFLGLILAAKGELEKRLPLDLTAARRARGLAVGGSSSGAHSGAPSVAVDAAAGAFGAGSAVATPPRGIASASASAPGSPVLHADGSSGAAHPAKRSSFSIPAAAPAAPVVGRLREDLLPSSAGAVMRPFESSPLRPALGAASSSSSSSSTAAAGGGRVSHPPLASDLVDGSSAAAGK